MLLFWIIIISPLTCILLPEITVLKSVFYFTTHTHTQKKLRRIQVTVLSPFYEISFEFIRHIMSLCMSFSHFIVHISTFQV